uniref:CCHC-type domain-containing protein n=1 Tax=Tanacetum cinerariifolium TaxID=118510 RepID=A0A6L2MPV1_TANCI|nr:hypothetical protein [Tanacetum cinerariifolium]
MMDKYCPQGELKKLEIELWNLKVKGNDVLTYTNRFQELTLICTKFVANESEKIDKYISGLPDSIYGNVKSSKPRTLDETIELTNDLMDQKLRTYAERADNKRMTDDRTGERKPYEGSLPKRTKCQRHHNGPCTQKCHKCNKVGHFARDCKSSGNANVANAQRDGKETPKGNKCFECGASGHFKRDCPKLKNKNRENRNAQGWVYAVGNMEKNENAPVNPDLNVVTETSLIPYGNETLTFRGNESNNGRESRLIVISCSKVQKYMAKGCQTFMAQISAKKEEDKSEGKQLKDVPIVRDFPKVFPEDLPGLPPARPVEFQIDLISGAAPVARALYRLAPSEMKELSKQLQELSDKGFIRPNPTKIESIKDCASPKTPMEIRQFLGLTGYYRRFIEGFSKISKSMTKLTQKGIKFDWGEKEENAFQLIKQKLCSASILALPEGSKDFVVYCDASHKGLGVVLMQREMKCYADEPLAMPLEGVQIDDTLQFVEEPVEIMEREIKRLKRSRIPLVKIRWNSRRGPEFTWECEDSFKTKYPHLFTNQTLSSTTRYLTVWFIAILGYIASFRELPIGELRCSAQCLIEDEDFVKRLRRGQLKQAVTVMVQQAMQYVNQTPDIETKIELIKTFNNVSAGKIFVEIERARLIKRLAKIKEEQGQIAEAVDLMQEIAFILEQQKKTKEGESIVEEAPADIPSLLELKRICNEHMIRYYSHYNNYLEICRCFKSIYEIPSIKEDIAKWTLVLRKICWITVKRLAELLCLTIEEVEKHLSEMVVSKALVAKVDRTMGVVSFQSAKDSKGILYSWASNLEKLPNLVKKSFHQILKETMVHKAILKA